MSNFAIVRLGKDTVPEIKTLDSNRKSPEAPIPLTIHCSQVPQEIQAGDYAFFCLGSDNNKGIPTAWARGLRALGTVLKKSGGPGYNDEWQVDVEVRVILPESITHKDFLAKASQSYFWFSEIPVLGVDTHSNQTIQIIREKEHNQNIAALFHAVKSIAPQFQQDTVKAYPDLAPYFNYTPPKPAIGPRIAETAEASAGADLAKLPEKFVNDCRSAGLHIEKQTAIRLAASLLAKRFVVLTGLSGSGKTKVAQAFARWLTPDSLVADPLTPGARFVSDRVSYVIKKADTIAIEFWNEGGEEGPTKNMVPREVIAEWADHIEKNGFGEDVSAQVLSDAIEPTSRFSAYLHRFRPFLKLAAFAVLKSRALEAPPKCYEIVPVGADWTSNEHILGYPDNLNGGYFQQTALRLILQAENYPQTPHFLILDEMNLSHVERYFADLLSLIESNEPLWLHRDDEAKRGIKARLALPENLFIIGTVNVDETTYMFSPKVLDRANVLEFRVSDKEMTGFLDTSAAPNLDKLAEPPLSGAVFGAQFVQSASRHYNAALTASERSQLKAELMTLFRLLAEHGAEFGFRVGKEVGRFLHFYKKLSGATIVDFRSAMDAQIIQKLLPKLHGSRNKLTATLWALGAFCAVDQPWKTESDDKKYTESLDKFLSDVRAAVEAGDEKFDPATIAEKFRKEKKDAHYPLSFDKLARMWRILEANGFVSFAEA